jgi:hypothetical protein
MPMAWPSHKKAGHGRLPVAHFFGIFVPLCLCYFVPFSPFYTSHERRSTSNELNPVDK